MRSNDTKLVVLNIPHSGTEIPSEERRYIELTDAELQSELDLMTDWYTKELFSDSALSTEFTCVSTNVSRLVCDVERFHKDSLEPMSKRGMGFVYKKTSDGKVLRTESNYRECKKRIKRKYYDTYHNELTSAVSSSLSVYGECVIVDCHSYDWLCNFITAPKNPVICLGSDSFHTPDWMIAKARAIFQQEGYTVVVNTPFDGSIVPLQYYNSDKRVKSMMIEVDRRLYLNGLDKDSEKFDKLQRVIALVISSLAEREDNCNRVRFNERLSIREAAEKYVDKYTLLVDMKDDADGKSRGEVYAIADTSHEMMEKAMKVGNSRGVMGYAEGDNTTPIRLGWLL